MTLKTATLIALIGTGISGAVSIVNNLMHFHFFYSLPSMIFNASLIIFFYVLYKKQQ